MAFCSKKGSVFIYPNMTIKLYLPLNNKGAIRKVLLLTYKRLLPSAVLLLLI